jgi:hypothetical protein
MSYKTISQHVQRYADQAGVNSKPFYARPPQDGVFALERTDGDELYSFGTHFVLAKLIALGKNKRGFWLVNGDRYSSRTTGHQNETRSALARTGLPMLIVPFSALDEANIKYTSIRPADITADRWEPVTRYASKREDIHSWDVFEGEPEQLPDGHWKYTGRQHRLGESVFTASYLTARNVNDPDGNIRLHAGRSDERRVRREYVNRTRTFLSAFDTNETQPLYFLAELPAKAHPKTVDEAREALKPEPVKEAEANGITVLRQGDVFAIPTDLATRGFPHREKYMRVLGVNHTVTEGTRVKAGGLYTYGRGVLRHDVGPWREREHKNVKLGDGKTWYRLVKNTVPEGRSWSARGQVD